MAAGFKSATFSGNQISRSFSNVPSAYFFYLALPFAAYLTFITKEFANKRALTVPCENQGIS